MLRLFPGSAKQGAEDHLNTVRAAASPSSRGGPAGTAALYAVTARLGFRRQFAYPQAALWGLITNFFFGALRIAVLLALFGTRPTGPGTPVAGWTASDAVTYVGLTQIFIGAFSLFGWTDFMRAVHRGEVVTDLLRPTPLLPFWAAQDAGRAAGQFVVRGLPMLVLFVLVWAARLPAQPLLTLFSVVLAWACGFAFRFLVNCAAFWSPDAVGIGRFAWAVQGLGCGFLMPLAFFPAWVGAALAWTPFPAMLNTVVTLWLGQKTGAAAWAALAGQLGWTLGLLALCALALARGLRRLEVAGG